jgi:hypothetical protein
MRAISKGNRRKESKNCGIVIFVETPEPRTGMNGAGRLVKVRAIEHESRWFERTITAERGTS